MNDLKWLRELIAIDSPSGFTEEACGYIHRQLTELGYAPEYTNKGAVRCALGPKPTRALAAHVDTLGGVVSTITASGRLRLSRVGGLSLNMAEGEYVRIRTLSGRVFTGTLLLDDPSVHANNSVASSKRDEKNMHVRLDEEVNSATMVRDLGIDVGDPIAFDPRYQELESGYIKSRFLDNKAGCFALLEVAQRLASEERQVSAELFFSNYEEVGHGGTVGYSASVEELLVIDMGVVGEACAGDERKCSICAKDSSGPYDYSFRKRLVGWAQEQEIPYVQDVYPYYGSDGSAALRAGLDLRVGLIGPGVAASHGVERTHRKGIEATVALCMAYLQ